MAPIEHIIVLMLENRSFDHMLGLLKHTDKSFPSIKSGDNKYTNYLTDGEPVPIWNDLSSYFVRKGPGHKHEDVMQQMFNVQNINDISDKTKLTMKGFAQNHFQRDHHSPKDVLRSFQKQSTPVLHQLAMQFKVCTNWFCSVPGATWPNRLFAMCGESDATVNNEITKVPYKLTSVFHSVENNGDWRVYHDGPCLPLAIDNIRDFGRKKKFKKISQLKEDIKNDSLSAFSWVEPDHFLSDSSSQHPQFISEEFDKWGFLSAENLMCDVYNWLRSKEKVFNKTVFIITYDEHGGFHDHVVPPRNIDSPRTNHIYYDKKNNYKFNFDLLGPRVPALVISPRVKPGSLDDRPFDHCAIIKAVNDCFIPKGKGILNKRVKWNPSLLDDFVDIVNPVSEMPNIKRHRIGEKPPGWQLKLSENLDDLLISLALLVQVLASNEIKKSRFNMSPSKMNAEKNRELEVRPHLKTIELFLEQQDQSNQSISLNSLLEENENSVRSGGADIVTAVHAVTEYLLTED